jgi:hypothetical protein
MRLTLGVQCLQGYHAPATPQHHSTRTATAPELAEPAAAGTAHAGSIAAANTNHVSQAAASRSWCGSAKQRQQQWRIQGLLDEQPSKVMAVAVLNVMESVDKVTTKGH